MIWRHLLAVCLGFCLAVAIIAYYLFAIFAATILFAIGLALIVPIVTAPLGLACIALGFKLLNPFRLRGDPWSGGKWLRGRMQGSWVARVGSYRILYTIEGPESSVTVVVRAIRHRAVAYRRP